jgi:hypothetical protein
MSSTPLEPVRSLWIGSSLPPAHQACIASFLRIGHPFELFTYEPLNTIPSGTILRSAADIIPKERIFRYGPAAGRGHGSLGAFSNLFRFALLLREGGYWVDTDMICLRPFPADPVVISAERRGDGRTTPSGGVLKCPAEHPLAQYCFYRANAANPETLVFGQTGPALLAAAVQDLNLESAVAPPDVFCFVDWFKHESLCAPGTIPDAAAGVHLWGERWRQMDTTIPWPGPPGSILHTLATFPNCPSQSGKSAPGGTGPCSDGPV